MRGLIDSAPRIVDIPQPTDAGGGFESGERDPGRLQCPRSRESAGTGSDDGVPLVHSLTQLLRSPGYSAVDAPAFNDRDANCAPSSRTIVVDIAHNHPRQRWPREICPRRSLSGTIRRGQPRRLRVPTGLVVQLPALAHLSHLVNRSNLWSSLLHTPGNLPGFEVSSRACAARPIVRWLPSGHGCNPGFPS